MSLHATDGRGQRWVLGGIGIIASLVFLVASMAMNWRFGFSLGKSELDGHIYGGISAAADAFKALCPFFYFAAWRQRAWAGAAASALVWVIVVLYASAGAAGHAGANRLDTVGQRTLAADTYKDLRADKKRYEDQLSWLPPHRAAAAVRADLEGVKAQRLWSTTSECQETAGKTAREFCQSYHKLDAELGNALKADEYNKKLEDISGKLAGTKGGAAVSDADPQASIISRMLVFVGVSVGVADTQTWLAIAVALLLEIGSTFGLYISVQYARGAAARSKVLDADYQEVLSRALEQTSEQGQVASSSAVPLIGQQSPQQQLAPPFKSEAAAPVPTPAPRTPLPGAEASLEAIGIPFKGDRTGPLLAALSGPEAAEALVAWIRAYGLAREDLSSEQISAYDIECCRARHRRQTSDVELKESLPLVKGRIVEKGRPRQPDGARPVRYTIKPGRYPKPPPALAAALPAPIEKPSSQEGGRLLRFTRPLSVAPRERAPIRHGNEPVRRAA